MTLTSPVKHLFSRHGFKTLTTTLLAIVMLSLAGCGGTKVYTVDKTMVYRDDIYNLRNVQRVGSRVEGLLPSGEVINLRGMDKKDVSAILAEEQSFVMTTIIDLDGQEVVYQRGRVERTSQWSDMLKRFERAQRDITKFMGDKKKTQLKLK